MEETSMSEDDILSLIFEDPHDVKAILDDEVYDSVLDYCLSLKKFLYLDYKGEQYREIVNFILDYEFKHDLELASKEELEKLAGYEYEVLPEKIKETNRVLSSKGYGLFSYPTTSDFYALFIAKLEYQSELTQEDLLYDDRIPPDEGCIKYYY
jgi:hypothetical protein